MCLVKNNLAVFTHGVCAVWTFGDALAAACAAFSEIKQFLVETLAFRVVAPCAVHGTAFEKDGCSYAVTVMDGILLYIKNIRCSHFYPRFFVSLMQSTSDKLD